MNNLIQISETEQFINYRDQLASDLKVGFVPTMGALHKGHAELLKRARQQCDITVLSIFVNPTQFNNPEDLNKYPRTLSEDLKIAGDEKVDVVFLPVFEDLYADQYRYSVTEKDFSKKLCGAHRPGHFDGVLSVVMKLLQITRPHYAYFGEKDYQQLRLIQDMVSTFFLRTKIVPCPTVREADGLAMSSRNMRLTPEGRKLAPHIYKCLNEFRDFEPANEYLQNFGVQLEYFEEHFNRRFIAAYLEGVRLIDNVQI
jgi:pantoate--beta-alanine ligase